MIDQFGLVEAAQESWGGAEYLRGAAHGVGGVVIIVEFVGHVLLGWVH